MTRGWRWLVVWVPCLCGCVPPGPCFGRDVANVASRPERGTQLQGSGWAAEGELRGAVWRGPWLVEASPSSVGTFRGEIYVRRAGEPEDTFSARFDPPEPVFACEGTKAVARTTLEVERADIPAGGLFKVGVQQLPTLFKVDGAQSGFGFPEVTVAFVQRQGRTP